MSPETIMANAEYLLKTMDEYFKSLEYFQDLPNPPGKETRKLISSLIRKAERIADKIHKEANAMKIVAYELNKIVEDHVAGNANE